MTGFPPRDAADRRGHIVVTYHYVRPENSDGVTGITPVEFDEQLSTIAREYRIVHVDEFVASRRSEDGLAVVTFDDAVCDQYEYAAEVLDRHEAQAVFYAPMRPYSEEADRWCAQHLLHALAQELGFAELDCRIERLVGAIEVDEASMNRLYHYETPEKRRLKYVLAFALPAAEAAAMLQAVNEEVGLRAEEWYMSAAELGDLQAAGHALGGHGFDHVAYTTLAPVQQEADMRRAVVLMNKLFGERPRTMAYPFGRFDHETQKLAREFGYTHMFSTDDRVDAKFLHQHLGALT